MKFMILLNIKVKKKWKTKIKKVKKNETTGVYSFCKKTWNLEDIKAIELIDKVVIVIHYIL